MYQGGQPLPTTDTILTSHSMTVPEIDLASAQILSHSCGEKSGLKVKVIMFGVHRTCDLEEAIPAAIPHAHAMQ